ncbi:unnamed protein product [Phaeothamnion confervicola]
MADIQARLAEARKKAEALKAEISKAQNDKKDATIAEVAGKKSDLKGLGPTPKHRRVLKGHFGKVYAMHWSGDSVNLVSASQDGKLIIWNGFTTNKVQAIPLRSSWVMTCAFEPTEGKFVACGGLDNLCSIYQLGQPTVMRATRELAAHDGYLSCCRFVDERNILTSSGDSTCIYWDIDTGASQGSQRNNCLRSAFGLAVVQ